MILESIKYERFTGKPREWKVIGKDGGAVHFGNINLMVGKNSVGKSRTLTLISDIAHLFSQQKIISQIDYSDWYYELELKEEEFLYAYKIKVEHNEIVDESLYVNGELKFDRNQHKIYSEKKKEFINIEISDKQVVTILRQNEEYPYLDEIYEWGSAIRKYVFTNQYEKSHLLEGDILDHINTYKQSPENIIELFYKGEEDFGEEFTEAIISDMKRLEYEINHISIEDSKLGSGIAVQEEEFIDTTSQLDMSQGMFRALAFIIQLNYALLEKASVCLLVDDIGEGLDFSRSKALIDVLVHKINNSYLQIFLTTNDRYIMNKTPIRYWSILDRKAKVSTIYNYYNSKDIFEDYKYTGLNNFDFLATDFYLHGFGKEEQQQPEDE